MYIYIYICISIYICIYIYLYIDYARILYVTGMSAVGAKRHSEEGQVDRRNVCPQLPQHFKANSLQHTLMVCMKLAEHWPICIGTDYIGRKLMIVVVVAFWVWKEFWKRRRESRRGKVKRRRRSTRRRRRRTSWV